jgi:hypothetical protein
MALVQVDAGMNGQDRIKAGAGMQGPGTEAIQDRVMVVTGLEGIAFMGM